jgi:lysophospholipase L1-like esterase
MSTATVVVFLVLHLLSPVAHLSPAAAEPSQVAPELSQGQAVDAVALVRVTVSLDVDVDAASAQVVSCLGDSITNGYPYAGTGNTYPQRLLVALEAAHGPGSYDVINHDVNGYRADQVLADLQTLNWMSEDPHLVLLMVGGNDLRTEILDPGDVASVIDQTVAEVQEIVDLVASHTNTDGTKPKIIVSAFPPNLIPGGSLVVAWYNIKLQSDLTGIDLWIDSNWDDLYDPTTGQARVSLMSPAPDLVHPNADGYAVMAENWLAAIEFLASPRHSLYLPCVLRSP